MVSRLLGGIEPMPVKNDTYFRHLKAGEKDYKRSDSGGLFMLVTKTGSKLWRYAYSFDSKQKLLALGQYQLSRWLTRGPGVMTQRSCWLTAPTRR